MSKYFFALAILMIIASAQAAPVNETSLKLLQGYLDNLMEALKDCKEDYSSGFCSDAKTILTTVSKLKQQFEKTNQIITTRILMMH